MNFYKNYEDSKRKADSGTVSLDVGNISLFLKETGHEPLDFGSEHLTDPWSFIYLPVVDSNKVRRNWVTEVTKEDLLPSENKINEVLEPYLEKGVTGWLELFSIFKDDKQSKVVPTFVEKAVVINSISRTG